MSDQFQPVNKKLLKWAQNLATDPHEFTHVLYNQACSIAELKRRIAELEAAQTRIRELPLKITEDEPSRKRLAALIEEALAG